MSGIVGIWNRDGAPVSPALLASLNRTLAYRGPDGAHQWIDGSVGLACQLSRVTPESTGEIQPLIHPSGCALVFDGRLDNRDEILRKLCDVPDIIAQSPDASLILALYQCHGERFAELLAGDFALGLFDPHRRRVLLARDALGIRPLYYVCVRDAIIFASEIKALLAHPDVTIVPNDDMLACFLLNSTPEDTSMTCFENIVSLRPAHLAIVTPGRVTTRQYWDFSVTEQRFDSFYDYAQAFRHHLTQAVRRRLRSAYPVAVSVSGGLDSSSIFCLAETLRRTVGEPGSSLLGLSYISPAGSPSDEREFLVAIERQYGLAIERVPINSLGPLNGSHEAMWHIETPFLDEQWNTTRTFYLRAQALGARVMMTGHWADQMLFPQAYLVDLFRQLHWMKIRTHLREFGRWMTDADPRMFRQRFWLDLIKHHAPAASVPYLRRLRAKRPPVWYSNAFCTRAFRHRFSQPLLGTGLPTVHARSLYDEARSPRHVQCMEWNNKVSAMHGMEITFPFLDRDLLSFLMSIPGEIQTWNGIPKALLREAMRGILPDAIVNRRWKADFTHLVNEGMERDCPRLLDRLESGSASAAWGYVNQVRLRDELRTLRDKIREAATGEAAWSLSDLLGLELWLQVFLNRAMPRTNQRLMSASQRYSA